MKRTAIALALLFALHQAVAAEADVERGAELAAQVCQACHGADGNGILPTYPRLAGQYADYMVKALKDYKEGKRGGANGALMTGLAATLSEQDMQDLAAYYANMEGLKDLTIK